MSIEAMKQALEALGSCWETGLTSKNWRQVEEAIASLRQAIEQAEKQEPVANYCRECLTYNGHQDGCSHANIQSKHKLTDKQILAANYPDGEENGPIVSAPDFDLICFARSIEAKLKEKNT